MKTSIQKYRPHNPLNLGVLKYKHRKMYSGGGDRSQELNWDKACLAGFLSRVSIFRDENVPFLLVEGISLTATEEGVNRYQGMYVYCLNNLVCWWDESLDPEKELSQSWVLRFCHSLIDKTDNIRMAVEFENLLKHANQSYLNLHLRTLSSGLSICF